METLPRPFVLTLVWAVCALAVGVTTAAIYPPSVVGPSVVFHVAFAVLPAALVPAALLLGRGRRLSARVALGLAASALCAIAWLLQLRFLPVVAPDLSPYRAGLVSNFYVLSHTFAAKAAIAYAFCNLACVFLFRRWGPQRLGPNNSSKPTPLRGAA